MNSVFFFGYSNLNYLNILYNIENYLNKDNFIAILLQFEEKSNFLISANYRNNTKQIELISKRIQNTVLFILILLF